MKVVALLIGRSGSSLKDKNLRLVAGRPLVYWPAQIATKANVFDELHCSSDDPRILDVAASVGYRRIVRPADLASASARGCDVIKHAIESGHINVTDSDIIVLQHANSATYTPEELRAAISELIDKPEYDSVIPSHQVDDYHPFRQKLLEPDGSVTSFFPEIKEISSNRQELPVAVAFNHTFWALRVSAIFSSTGQQPWTCMGKRIIAHLTEPNRLDVHRQEDLEHTKEWLGTNLPDLLAEFSAPEG